MTCCSNSLEAGHDLLLVSLKVAREPTSSALAQWLFGPATAPSFAHVLVFYLCLLLLICYCPPWCCCCLVVFVCACLCLRCRYSGSILLHPLGVSSELTMAWLALPNRHKMIHQYKPVQI
jgi:hypothetical protein